MRKATSLFLALLIIFSPFSSIPIALASELISLTNLGGDDVDAFMGSTVYIAPDIVVSGDQPILSAEVSIDPGRKDGRAVYFNDEIATLEWTDVPGITVTHNGHEYFPKILMTGSASTADYQTLLRSFRVTPKSENDAYNFNFKFELFTIETIPTIEHESDHYFVYILAPGISWTDAKAGAESLNYNGRQGYLATITDQNEQNVLTYNFEANGLGWIGANDAANEGTWKWETGPETGLHFWTGTGGEYWGWNGYEETWIQNGHKASDDSFEYWADASWEPNSDGDEDYAAIDTNGFWYDYPHSHGAIQGYYVEFGGMAGDSPNDPVVNIQLDMNPEFAVRFWDGDTYLDWHYPIEYGETITALAHPEKSGYDFDGWYSDVALTQAWDFETDTVSQSMNLYAKYLKHYTILYDTNGGVNDPGNPSYYTQESETLTLLPASRNGFAFEGWSPSGTIESGSTGDKSLAALWAGLPYDVTFVTNGAAAIDLIEDAICGSLVDEPATPVRSGYKFGGWYSDAAFTTAWSFDTDCVPAYNLTLYAKWIAQFEFNADTNTITKYIGDSADVVIPSFIDGVAVQHIGTDTFSHYDTTILSSVVFSEGVQTIGYEAFRGNNLTSITTPGSLRNIGDYAFADNLINSVTFVNGVDTIGSYAFSGNDLTALVTPLSLRTIENNAFEGNAITSLQLGDGLEDIQYSAFRGVSGDLMIPDTVSSIGSSAFADGDIRTLVLPDTLSDIGVYAFANNVNLKSVDLPSAMTVIPKGMFGGCGLTSITIPDNVTTIGDYAFDNCALTAFSLPNGLDTIGIGAFRGNSLATNGTFTLPDSIRGVHNFAFEGNGFDAVDNKIALPKSAEGYDIQWSNGKYYIDNFNSSYTAYISSYLTDFNITYELGDGQNDESNPFSYTMESDTIILVPPTWENHDFLYWIPSSMILSGSTGDKTFTTVWAEYDYDITYDLGGGVNSATNPHGYNNGSETITLADPTREGYDFTGWSDGGTIPGGSTGSKHFAASWTIAQYDVTFDSLGGSDVTSILGAQYQSTINAPTDPTRGGYFFDGWYLDTDYQSAWDFDTSTIPANDVRLYAKWIEAYDFDANSNTIIEYLGTNTVIDIPVSIGGVPVYHIGEYAFTGKSIIAITVPEGIQTIGNFAFYDNAITALSIPSTVTTIGHWAFKNNDIDSLTVPGNVKSIGGSAFLNNSMSSLTLNEGLETIGSSAFGYDDRFKGNTFGTVTIPNSVTSVGDMAFSRAGINDLTISNNLAQIPYGVFSSNSELTSVELPSELTSIGIYAFLECGLTGIEFPEELETIDIRAFMNCTSLSSSGSITLPGRIRTVGSLAFGSCGFGTEEGNAAKVMLPSQSNGYLLAWKKDDVAYTKGYIDDFNATYTCTLTSTAVDYNITYVLGGGTNNPANPAVFNVNSGTIDLLDPTREGYTFAGWLPSYQIAMGTFEDQTVTANWTATEYSITYKLNGGVNGSGNPSSYTIESDTIVLADPTRVGYTFAGWAPTDRVESGSTGNKPFSAAWTLNDYQVSFHPNGGTIIEPISVEYQAKVGTPDAPTKEGYTFDGWYADAAFYTAWNFDTDIMPAENMTMYAKWTINDYNVTFNSTGGTAVDPIADVLFGSKISAPSEPTRTGYTFAGWFCGENLANEWDFDTDTMPSSNLVLSAKWTVNTYNVSFDTNGGSYIPSKFGVEYGTSFDQPADPSRTGYTFEGWFSDSKLAVVWSFDNEIPAQNIVLYAKWTPIVYSVSYNLYGGVPACGNPASYTIESETIALNAPTREGYYFYGWSPDGKIESGSYGNKTFSPIWVPTIYLIKYDLGGGDNAPTNPVSYTIESDTIMLADPIRAGYTFEGWSSDGLIETGSTGNRLFTATWSTVQYDITYHMDGGVNHEGNPTSYDIESEEITLADPTKAGYSFAEWSPEGVISSGSYGDKAFTASWMLTEYIISYNLNGGVNHEENPSDYTIESSTITLEDPTRTGHTFSGWSPEGVIANGSHGDKTFTANWTLNTHAISFVSNGGSEVDTIENAGYGLKIQEPDAPVRTGYSFAGWYKDDAFNNAWVFDTDTMPDAAITLYAAWLADEYSIAYNLNGGINHADNPPSYNIESSTFTLADPTRTGYAFTGWSPVGAIFSGSHGDKTYTASWMPIEYDITYTMNGGVNHAVNLSVYTIESDEITLAVPTQTGYTFTGWSPEGVIASGSHGDKTFTASWTLNRYDVSFDSNDGSDVGLLEGVGFGETFDSPVAPVRSGYTFGGWFADSELNTAWNFDTDTMPDHALTMHAKWTANEYAITYHLEGGTNTSGNPSVYTIESEEITLEDPTKTGYTFAGWLPGNTIESGSTGNCEFTATWIPSVYSITYNLDGGTNYAGHPTEYTILSDTIVLDAPTRFGYTFAGWLPEGVIENGSYDDKTFVATWTPIEYSIIYDLNGGVNSPANSASYTIADDTIILADPTREGHTFTGWTPEGVIINRSHGDRAFIANWTINRYTVALESRGGTAVNPIMGVEFGTKVDEPEQPTKEGHTFAGWYCDEEATQAWIFETDMMPAHDIVLYAKWAVNHYTVSFDAIGGTTVDPLADAAYGTLIQAPDAPKKKSYVFAGWYLEEQLISEWDFEKDILPYENITLYAKWTPVEYTVSYVLNGGMKNAQNPNSYTVESDTIMLADPSREGYTFAGWSPSSRIIRGSTGDRTFTASWAADAYTIAFDGNGNTGGNMAEQIAQSQQQVRLYLNAFVNSGYHFTGWNTRPDGSGVAYVDGAFIEPVSANIILYAQWEINRYNIVYNGNVRDESINMPRSIQNVAAGTHVVVTDGSNAERSGYILLGFTEDPISIMPVVLAAGSYAVPETLEHGATITLYALWERDDDGDGISDIDEQAFGEGVSGDGVEPQTGSIKGCILNLNGQPVTGAVVILNSTPRVTTTDDNGEFIFEDVPLTPHTITVRDSETNKNICQYELAFAASILSAVGASNDMDTGEGGAIEVDVGQDFAALELNIQQSDTREWNLSAIVDTNVLDKAAIVNTDLDRGKTNSSIPLWLIMVGAAFVVSLCTVLIIRRAHGRMKND